MASSSVQTICEAVAADLTTNVEGLRDASVHLLTPWDPEQQVSDGDKHLAVWPQAEDTEVAVPSVTDGGKMLGQLYAVLYWEPAGDESSRGVADFDAASDLFALWEASRDRFFKTANVFIGGTELTEYVGSRFPERSGQVRWFAMAFQTRKSKSLS